MSHLLPSHLFSPLTEKQLRLVWQWRNSPRIQHNMHSNQPVEWQTHCDWFSALQQDESRQFFLLWQNQRPIGVLNFSALDTTEPEWGCYLGETNVWPGSGILLECAALDYTANVGKFECLVAQVLSFNQSANKMHKVFEYEQVNTQYGGVREGQPYQINVYKYNLQQWLNKRTSILKKLPKNIQLAIAKTEFSPQEPACS